VPRPIHYCRRWVPRPDFLGFTALNVPVGFCPRTIDIKAIRYTLKPCSPPSLRFSGKHLRRSLSKVKEISRQGAGMSVHPTVEPSTSVLRGARVRPPLTQVHVAARPHLELREMHAVQRAFRVKLPPQQPWPQCTQWHAAAEGPEPVVLSSMYDTGAPEEDRGRAGSSSPGPCAFEADWAYVSHRDTAGP
jgi:hypothetical protein